MDESRVEAKADSMDGLMAGERVVMKAAEWAELKAALWAAWTVVSKA